MNKLTASCVRAGHCARNFRRYGLRARTQEPSSLKRPKDGPPAAKPAAKPSPGKTVNVNFKDVKLKNGLRVLLVEDHSAPVVSLAITFDVGSRNERKGRTGFAHLFEHMMFTGSENVGRNEYSLWIDTNGGSNNATTSEDRTLYYATVPSNQLDMILFLESDRIRALDVSGEPRHPAQGRSRRAPAARGQRALRQDRGEVPGSDVRQLRLQTFSHRLDGRPERGQPAGRERVLPNLLCAEQRRARPGRRFQGRRGARQGQKIFRGHSVAARAAESLDDRA